MNSPRNLQHFLIREDAPQRPKSTRLQVLAAAQEVGGRKDLRLAGVVPPSGPDYARLAEN